LKLGIKLFPPVKGLFSNDDFRLTYGDQKSVKNGIKNTAKKRKEGLKSPLYEVSDFFYYPPC
jgi:hypothetical protein